MGDQTWARFLIELLPLLPNASYSRADVVTSMRMTKDAAEIADLSQWIKDGAAWPKARMPASIGKSKAEYEKLRNAGNRDVHDTSKTTTLPIAREIVEAYVTEDVKLPWYIDLLNITLETRDLTEAKRRIRMLAEAFRNEGTRITENLNF